MKAVLLDIEGTTTPVAFVYEVLFPFARAHLEEFLRAHWDEPSVQADVASLGANLTVDEAIAGFLGQMDRDEKATGLKSLQGKIWEGGYRSGRLRGAMFEDVEPALRRWGAAGIPVFIYSSGSIEAQKLIFGCSTAGNLLPLLAGHFDTTTGDKKQVASYRRIADAIGMAAADVLFLTDNLAEAAAARDAGMEVRVAVRPGNAALPAHGFTEIRTFAGL